jgi:hypothetical protein
MVTLDAQELGTMYAAKLSLRQFMQELLERFRAKGAPVEWGGLGLRLAHGQLLHMKTHPQGPMYHGYLWMPDEMWASLEQYKKDAGFAALETGVVQ